jgi:hypothetical protein
MCIFDVQTYPSKQCIKTLHDDICLFKTDRHCKSTARIHFVTVETQQQPVESESAQFQNPVQRYIYKNTDSQNSQFVCHSDYTLK